jgi:hypothetical protein
MLRKGEKGSCCYMGVNTHSMRQYTGQMSKESLVDCKDTLRGNGLIQAVEYTLVEVASLVVHSGHNRVWIAC